jgi:hypothetical protein
MKAVARAVWSKSGSRLCTFSLRSFFGIPRYETPADPRVIYDALSGRWFASVLGFSSILNKIAGSTVYLAVSAGPDPTGLWWVYVVQSNSFDGILYDQPFIGLSSDKVVISWNDYYGASCSGSSPSSPFSGQETVVLAKADLLSGFSVRVARFGPDCSKFRVVPAQALTHSGPAYLVYNGWSTSSPGYLGLVTVTGSPAFGNVAWSEQTLSMPATSIPPKAYDGLAGIYLDTNDDYFQTAVWQNGILWTAGNTGCVPRDDTTKRSCLRLVQVSTTTPSLLQSFDVGLAERHLMYPAVAVDRDGNMFVTFSATSATKSTSYAGVWAGYQAASGPLYQVGDLVAIPMVAIHDGEAAYGCSRDPKRENAYRWGDYSGASLDPADPTTVWLTGEYAAAGTVDCNWGNWTAQVRLLKQPTPTPTRTLTPTPTPTGTLTPWPTPTPTPTP